MRERDVDRFGGKEVRVELVSGDKLTATTTIIEAKNDRKG
jgi:hypothetical protein